jgi:hypothetical protein
MNVATFQNLIVKIFKSHGFDIDSTSNYNKYILATKDNIILSVGYAEPADELSVGQLRNFFRTAKRDNADRLIYIVPSNYPIAIDRFAAERKIQLWDRERLERELGRALVTDLETLGEIDQAEGISDSLFKTTSEQSTGQPTESQSSDSEDIPIMVPTMIFGDETETGGSTTTGTTSDGSTLTSSTQITGAVEDPLISPDIKEVNIIKPKVTKDLAANMANKIVKGFRFNLELIPYYVFDYSFKLDIENQENALTTGILGINGLTSNVEDWSVEVETIKNLEEPHTKLGVKFTFDNALSLIKQAIMDRNTKMIETREEYDSTIIFEKKKLKPKPEAIDINSKGLFYLPVWCIEGSNGLMIIDANSGKVIKEDIFKVT